MKDNRYKTLCFLLFFVTTLIYSQGARVVVITQKYKSLDTENNWLPSVAGKKFESNIRAFMNYTIVDYANESEIKKLQAKSENDSFDETTAIELGKLTNANYAFFLGIQKTNDSYIVSIDYTDLTTGVKRANSLLTANSAKAIFDDVPCVIDKMTLDICTQLQINLTPSQKYILQNGNKDINSDERIAQSIQEEEFYKKQIKALDEEIKKSSDLITSDSVATKQKLEAQRALQDEKLKSTQEYTKRLKQEQQKRLEDEKQELSRKDEQKKKRDDLSKEVAQKVLKAQQLLIQNLSVFAQMEVVQQKKYTLGEIRQSIIEQKEQLAQEVKNEIATKREYLFDLKNARKTELSSGQLTDEAIDRREKDLEQFEAQINETLQKNIASMEFATQKQETILANEITNGESQLSHQKATSLTNDIKVIYGNYDGKEKLWDATIYIFSKGEQILNCDFSIKYDMLPAINKKKPDPKKDFDAYSDIVDIYDSLFTRGENIFTYEVEYEVIPKELKNLSQYTFRILNIIIKDTLTQKVLSTIKNPITDEQKVNYEHKFDFTNSQWANATKKQSKEKNNFKQFIIKSDADFIFSGGFTEDSCADYNAIMGQMGESPKSYIRNLAANLLDSLTHFYPDNYNEFQKKKLRKIINDFLTPVIENLKDGIDKTQVTKIIIPKSTKIFATFKLDYSPFTSDPDTTYTPKKIPRVIKFIGNEAFKDCTMLKTVDARNITKIGAAAFMGCTKLETIKLPDSGVEISSDAFVGCVSLLPEVKEMLKKLGYKGTF